MLTGIRALKQSDMSTSGDESNNGERGIEAVWAALIAQQQAMERGFQQIHESIAELRLKMTTNTMDEEILIGDVQDTLKAEIDEGDQLIGLIRKKIQKKYSGKIEEAIDDESWC